jgi:hypothetical protein
MGERIGQTLILALSFVIMFFYAMVSLLVIFISYIIGLSNESAQIIIVLMVILSLTVFADIMLKMIYKT